MPKQILYFSLIACLGASLLAGCGTKGPNDPMSGIQFSDSQTRN